MTYKKVWAVYFSPCGSTRCIAESIAKSLGDRLCLPFEGLDWTLPVKRETTYAFEKSDIVIWGAPVYAGRLPNKLLPFLHDGFNGNGALAVPITVFGNRHFDDALFEFDTLLRGNGFTVVAGAALAAKHVFSSVIAPERPDALDMEAVEGFAERLAEKASNGTLALNQPVFPKTNDPIRYYIPKGTDGEPTHFLKAKPLTDADKCSQCGLCASLCPMGSIDRDSPAQVTGICIKCHACVNGCKVQAKMFTDPAFLFHKQMLEQHYRERKQSCFFI